MSVTSAYPILVVEDNDEDYELLSWALKKLSIKASVFRCEDGDDTLDFLRHQGQYGPDGKVVPRPAIILLDLSLTVTDGHEVLERIKQDDELKMIPVIVWTMSSDPHDIDICFKQGANSYILKPMSIERLLEAIEMLNRYWFGIALLPEDTNA